MATSRTKGTPGAVTSVSASSPLASSGGATPNLTIQNAAADGSTKGAAAFASADFNSSSGVISLDYANGQKATASVPGYLSAADWAIFNAKQPAGNYLTALTGDTTASGPGSAVATTHSVLGHAPDSNNTASTLVLRDGSGGFQTTRISGSNSSFNFDGGKIDSSFGTIFDLTNGQFLSPANTVIIDFFNQDLYDSAGVLSQEWGTRKLYNSGVFASLNWENSTLYSQAYGVGTLDWNAGNLVAPGGTLSLDWVSRTLKDTSGTTSIAWSDRIGYDNSGLQSIDYQNRILKNSAESVVINWEGLQLLSPGGLSSVDWGNRWLIDASSMTSVLWQERELYSAVGGLSVDWNARNLIDNGNTLSVDWVNRVLTSTSGSSSVDWQNDTLTAQDGTESINWTNRTMNSSDGSQSINYEARLLLDPNGNAVIDWNTYLAFDLNGQYSQDWNARKLYNASGGLAFDYDFKTIYDASDVMSADFNGRHLKDASAVNSVNYGDRELKDSAGSLAIGWEASARKLYDNVPAISLNFQNRILTASDGSTTQINWTTANSLTLNKVGNYNGTATAGRGMPAILAIGDYTAQGGAIGATGMGTAPANALIKVSWVATITRAATSSSVLGGANGFQLVYTDGDDSVTKTSIVANSVTSAANTTGTSISGSLMAWVKSGTIPSFTFGYTSAGGTSMQYNLHVRSEIV